MATRTQKEIVDRINDRKAADIFGFEWGEYLGYLDYDHAKPFIKEGTTAEEWAAPPACTKEALVEVMRDYMEFAWGKANDMRGISANRSVEHYIAWLWLAGEDDFGAEVEQEYEDNYQHYGKEILIMICERYGWDYSKWDNGERTNGGE
jgi:hypothetical protein